MLATKGSWQIGPASVFTETAFGKPNRGKTMREIKQPHRLKATLLRKIYNWIHRYLGPGLLGAEEVPPAAASPLVAGVADLAVRLHPQLRSSSR
jgi:hypothetical protein